MTTDSLISQTAIDTDSILDTIKELLPLSTDDNAFDKDLIILINAAFNSLARIGVGSFDNQFKITGSTETWSEFIEDYGNIEAVKEYVYIRVKLAFDPPQSSAVMEELKHLLKEDEFTIQVSVDPGTPLD